MINIANVEPKEIASIHLTDKEFTEILALSDATSKETLLKNLTHFGKALPLHQYWAACDIVGMSHQASEMFEKKLIMLKRHALADRKDQWLRYRIYRQAYNACASKGSYLHPDLREKLSSHVIKDDAWSTYLAFFGAIKWNRYPNLIELLPGDEISSIIEGQEIVKNMDGENKVKTSNLSFDIPTQDEFIKYVDDFLKDNGIKASTFGREFMGDSAFISRLRKGNDPQLSTMHRICRAVEKIRQDHKLQKILQEMME
jgi:hypothetical protein